MNVVTVVAIFLGLLTNHHAIGGWIDEDTPLEKHVVTSLIDGTEYKLVCENRSQWLD